MAERHPRLAVVPVCASFVVALLLAATALAQAPGRVTGVVRDEDEQPIKGATVTAQNTSVGLSYTSSTDEKGRFFLIGLRPGDWGFIAGAPGFAASGSRMNVRAASNLNPPMLFTLRRNGPGAGGALEKLTGKDLQDKLENADKLFSQQKYDDAIGAYRSIMSSAAPLVFLNLQIASAYVAKNDLGRAQAAYEDLLKVDATNEKALVGIAAIKQQQGSAQDAQAFLLKATESAGTGREVFLALGELAVAAGQPDEAANWFTKASTTDPYWGRPLYRLAQLASAKGDTAAAEGFMRRVIAVDPTSPEAGLARNALEQSGS